MSIEELGTQLQAFLRGMLEPMVRQPAEVAIVMSRSRGVVVYDVRVAPEDVGRVIGHRGQTARALRTIVSSWSGPRNFRYELNLPQGGEGERER